MSGVVPCRMELVATDVQSSHLLVADLDALLVGPGVEHAFDLQARLGGGSGDRLDRGGAALEWRPRQFCVMWRQNRRCSILFHFEVPGGWSQTLIGDLRLVGELL